MLTDKTVLTAYHGCDKSVAEKIISGSSKFETSENKYNWLGDGVYFWESAPTKAMDWAKECKKNPKLTKGIIKDPYVVGVEICVENAKFWDLLDKSRHGELVKSHADIKKVFPKNRTTSSSKQEQIKVFRLRCN